MKHLESSICDWGCVYSLLNSYFMKNYNISSIAYKGSYELLRVNGRELTFLADQFWQMKEKLAVFRE